MTNKCQMPQTTRFLNVNRYTHLTLTVIMRSLIRVNENTTLRRTLRNVSIKLWNTLFKQVRHSKAQANIKTIVYIINNGHLYIFKAIRTTVPKQTISAVNVLSTCFFFFLNWILSNMWLINGCVLNWILSNMWSINWRDQRHCH